MPGAPFFLKVLKGYSDHLVSLNEFLGNFSDTEKWIRWSMHPGLGIMAILQSVGSTAWLLEVFAGVRMPRLIALYRGLWGYRPYMYFMTLHGAIHLLFIWFNDYAHAKERIQGACAWLPPLASSTCRLAGTGFLHLLLLLNLPSATMRMTIIYPSQYLIVLILAALTVVEFATYAFPVAVLACVWIKIYGQLLKAFCPNLEPRWPRKTYPSLEEVCRAASSADVLYRDLHAELDVALARPELPAHLRLSSFALLQQRWYTLRHSDAAHLVLSSRFFAWLASDEARNCTPVGVQRSLLFPALRALIPLLEDELSRRGPSPDISPRTFDHAIYELAGIFIKYLIPLPQIKHLGRLFRLRALLPFFLPYPLIRLIPTRAITFDPQTTAEALADGPAPQFTFATIASLRYFDEARLSPEESVDIFELLLRTFKAQEDAVKAEDKAHEAVLETVLLWRERKNELEIKRFKRE